MIIIPYMKAATGWEAQLGRLVLRVCTLRGAYWRYRPWRRVSVSITACSDLYDEDLCPGHVASATNAKVCGRCGTHIDSFRPADPEDSAP